MFSLRPNAKAGILALGFICASTHALAAEPVRLVFDGRDSILGTSLRFDLPGSRGRVANINVNLTFDTVPAGLTPREEFLIIPDLSEGITLANRAKLGVASSSGQALIEVKYRGWDVIPNDPDGVQINYHLQLHPVAKIAAPAREDARDISIKSGKLRFKLPIDPAYSKTLSFHLSLARERFLADDLSIFNGEVATAAVSLGARESNGTWVTVDLSKLRLVEELKEKKYKLEIRARVKAEASERWLNQDVLGANGIARTTRVEIKAKD